MKFCPRCGSVLLPKKEGGKTVLACVQCGYVEEAGSPVEYSVKSRVEHHPSQKIHVVEEERIALPRTKALCPKCGNNEAYFWMQQTRAGDEPPTRFYRCTRCGYTWREYE